MGEYSIQRLSNSEEHLKQCALFLNSEFSESSGFTKQNKATSDYLNWLYFENPRGSAIAFSAYYQREMVSHFATIPIDYEVEGTLRKGLLALNLVTHPNHRGKGLFIRVASETLDCAKKEGYDFVIGVSNQNSSYGLINKLGFTLVGQLKVLVGIGSIIPDYNSSYKLKPVWNKESLQWRLRNPSFEYFLARKSIAIVPTGVFGIYAQLTGRKECEKLLFEKGKKTATLRVWIGLTGNIKKKGIFMYLPPILKPVPLNFIYRDLKDENKGFKVEDVLFELIDFDAY